MKNYQTGQRFIHRSSEEHILAQVDRNRVALIGLLSGNRWADPIEVSSSMRITEEELRRIMNKEWGDFQPIY